MGNECSEDEREFRYQTLHQAIYAIENDIKKELFSSDISKKKYIPFGLINKGICHKYRFLLNENFDTNAARAKVFNYKDLVKKVENKNFDYINKSFNFGFPSDFMLVNQDFLDVIINYIPKQYTNQLSTIFNAVIGGECIILKGAHDKTDENPFRYINLYFEIKEEMANEIDFFIYIKDKKERQDAEEHILKNNLWNYFKKIRFNYKDEYKKIYNEKKQEIGYLVRCSEIIKIESYIQKVNSLKGLSSKNFQFSQCLMFDQKIVSQLNFLDPVITFLFQMNELKTFLETNQNVDLQTFKNVIMTKIGPKINGITNYQNTFNIILSSLDQSTQDNKEYYNLSILYDEEKGLNKFMENHKNGNIIQKIFLIPIEEVISCKKCGMKTFHFRYDNYIYIQNPLNDLIYQKIFNSNKEQKKGRFCTFCNGQETEVSIEKKNFRSSRKANCNN